MKGLMSMANINKNSICVHDMGPAMLRFDVINKMLFFTLCLFCLAEAYLFSAMVRCKICNQDLHAVCLDIV